MPKTYVALKTFDHEYQGPMKATGVVKRFDPGKHKMVDVTEETTVLGLSSVRGTKGEPVDLADVPLEEILSLIAEKCVEETKESAEEAPIQAAEEVVEPEPHEALQE